MNWSSTIDAEFISQTLECTTADEVFLQLKASSNIGADMHDPFDSTLVCLDRLTSGVDFEWTLVLRKWHPNHNIGMEFRCFIGGDSRLLGIAQKDDSASYKFLESQELLNTIYDKIIELVPKVVQALDQSSFIMDVYIDIAPRYQAWVQDISPFLPGCQRLES